MKRNGSYSPAAVCARSPLRLAANKSLRRAIYSTIHSTPRRGAHSDLGELGFLIHLSDLFYVCFETLLSCFAVREGVIDDSHTETASGMDSGTVTPVAGASVPPAFMLTDKQAKVGSTVDWRKFAKEHRRLDRMAVVRKREDDDDTNIIGSIFAIFVSRCNFPFLYSSTSQMAAGDTDSIQSRHIH